MKNLLLAILSSVLAIIAVGSAQAQITGSEKPTRLDDLPRYLESVLPPEAKGRVNVVSGFVETYFNMPDSTNIKQRAQKTARDFVLAVYNTELPIRGVKIEVMQPNRMPGLTLALGANITAKYRQEINDKLRAEPVNFITWMKTVSSRHVDGLGADQIYLSGIWADVVPNNVNLVAEQNPTVNQSSVPSQTTSSKSPADTETNRNVQDAFRSLNKIAESLNVGINYLQYEALIAEARSRVSDAARTLPDGELRNELGRTLVDYVFAGEVWMSSTNEYILAVSDVGKMLTEKYSPALEAEGSNQVIRREVAFRAIVNSARRRINAVASLLSK